MKKIIRTNLEHLVHEGWFAYQLFLISLINKHVTLKELLAAILALLQKNHADASEAIEIVRTNRWSRDVDEADLLRDRLVGSVNIYIRAFLYDIDPEKSRAAQNLLPVIEHYGDMAKAPQDKESGMIINFLDELNSNYSAEITAIGLADRLAQLKAANEQFLAAIGNRTEDIASRTLRMRDVRREGNQLIRMLYAQVELLLLTAPSDELTAFANELNAENSRVNANRKRTGNEG
jgi:hypothetical protein